VPDRPAPTITRRHTLDRRSFLGGLAVGPFAASGLTGCAAPLKPPELAGGDPFSLGVASGEPAADGFVLWTRLAPEPLLPAGRPDDG
jgi:alkaline phosphatase D